MDISRSTGDPHSFAIPELARVIYIDLELIVDFNQKVLEGKAILTIERKPSTSEIILDNFGLVVSHVTDTNGIPLNYHVGNSYALGSPFCVQLPQTFDTTYNSICKIQIVYKTSPTSPALYWLTREQTTDGRHPFLLSNNKLIYARSWFPCQDTPSVKFEYSAKIFVQKNFRVLMSALLQSIYDAGPELDIHEFHQNKSVSSYAVIIAVGSLLEIKLDARINIFAERNLIFSERSSRFVKNILKLRRSAQKLLNAAESLCGPYLWGIYDICVLPPSIAHFEIECPCVTFISPTLLGGDDCYMSPLARNISQSWAGNLVTCSNYEHLWLNKSLSIFTYRKIGCTMYLNYEEMNEFFQREDLRNLSMQIKNFENRGLLKCLIPNLTGMSPHKATKYVPYEWGCKLLHHLESILGGPAEFEKFLKYYFRSFAYRSINTIDWINCLYQYFPHKKRILDCVEWYLWLFNITSPLIVPRGSILEIHCFRLALDWEPENNDIIVNNRNFQLIANEFCDVERIIFLICHTFKTNLTKEELRSMMPIFAFNIRNVEIRFYWLLLCIKARCARKVESALNFAIKFCFPNYACLIFQFLYEWTEMRPVVIETYMKNKEKMLYETQKELDRILHLTS